MSLVQVSITALFLAAAAAAGLAPSPPVKTPLIVPRPKRVSALPGAFRIAWAQVVSIQAPRGETRLRAILQETAREMALPVDPLAVSTSAGSWTSIRIGSPVVMSTGAGEWARNPEGYRLVVSPGGIRIDAPRPQGAAHALQTLAQLRAGSAIPCMQVEDWPSLPFRGAHFFPSASGAAFQGKLIRRVLARYKLNHAVIQCEAAQWRSHPEIAHPDSISRRDLHALVDQCRERFVEPVPLINGPGHAEWMFRNRSNLHLAEDPATPYAYCVLHPGSRRLMRDILSEALQVFKPKVFHLGHDEVTLRGRFPRPDCPRCRGRSVTDLVFANLREHSDWLRAKGVRSMIWGDMLFAKEERVSSAHAPNAPEALKRRRAVPRDVTVADWHYNVNGGYPSLELLSREGKSAVACTWYEPLNIHRFAQEALRTRTRGGGGLLQTTWAGYFPDEKVLRGKELRQFTAFILAAEYAWSGRADAPADLGYNPVDLFKKSYGR